MGIESALIPILVSAIGGGASAAISKKLGSGDSSKKSNTSANAQASLDNFNKGQAYSPILERRYNPAPEGYRMGVDPEHQFFTDVVTGYRPMVPGMAAGGPVDDDARAAQSVVAAAREALMGGGRDPQGAIKAFIDYFGMEEFIDFRNEILGQGGRSGPAEKAGLVTGPGGGMDDLVPARSPSRDILLSDGEFVLPADVVSGLGDGSTKAGAEQLEGLMELVRRQRTGKPTQPKRLGGGIGY